MKKFLCLFFVFLSCFCVFGCAENSKNDAKIINVEEIVINKSHAYCDKGDKIVLLAQVYPFNANNQNIIWKSDNQEIATVSDGVVEAKNEGRTVIKAISEDGNFCDSCVLYVSSPKLNYDTYQNNLTKINQKINENNAIIISRNYIKEINQNLNESFENVNENNKNSSEKDYEFYEKNNFENDFFGQFEKKFETMQNQIYTIKNNILNNITQKKLKNFENFNENDVKIVENKKITNNENEENEIENVLQNVENFKKNEKVGGLQALDLETEDVDLDEIAENQNHGYFFEYKFNSNGIDDEEDEFTSYKNDKEILREFSW